MLNFHDRCFIIFQYHFHLPTEMAACNSFHVINPLLYNTMPHVGRHLKISPMPNCPNRPVSNRRQLRNCKKNYNHKISHIYRFGCRHEFNCKLGKWVSTLACAWSFITIISIFYCKTRWVENLSYPEQLKKCLPNIKSYVQALKDARDGCKERTIDSCEDEKIFVESITRRQVEFLFIYSETFWENPGCVSNIKAHDTRPLFITRPVARGCVGEVCEKLSYCRRLYLGCRKWRKYCSERLTSLCVMAQRKMKMHAFSSKLMIALAVRCLTKAPIVLKNVYLTCMVNIMWNRNFKSELE